MKFCPQCGKELVPGDRFCMECGFDTLTMDQPVNPLGETPSVQPTTKEPPRFVPPVVTNTVGPTSTDNSLPLLQNSTRTTQSSSGKSNVLRSLLIVFICITVLGIGGWLTYTQLLKDQPIEKASVATPENDVKSVQPSTDKTQIINTDKKLAFVFTINPKSIEAEKQGSLQVTKDNFTDKNPDGATRLIIKRSSIVLKITTDHYNDSKGTTNVGSITITGDGGMVIGTYPAKGKAGTDGTTNGKWVIEPQVRLDPGIYYIQDSQPSTWSKNDQGVGLLNIEGYEI